MAIKVETKDCTSLSDSDLQEMADLSAGSPRALGVGELSEQAESWVLVTRAREGNRLRAFSFCTLERIGGTPCVLMGAGHIARTYRRSTVLRFVIADQMRRAALSFPDEDVLFGTQINDPGGFEALAKFHDVVPAAGQRPSGENRAWGRRLAKRFGISLFRYDDGSFTSHMKNPPPIVFDHISLKPEMNSPEMADLLKHVVQDDGDTLLVHGWAMSEELEKLI